MAPTLLLADDSVTIQRVIELTFANEDVKVLVAGDGQQAIKLIDAERPDIILADVGMPKVDGYAVATHVKQSAALKRIPVLLLTGAFEPIDEDRARATGCDGVLVKPFEPQKLVARVRELVAGRRPPELWPVDMPRIERRVNPDQNDRAEPEARRGPAPPQPARAQDAGPRPINPPPTFGFGNRDDDPLAFPPRRERADLPPPSDALDSELDVLDAMLSRLDPTAHPQELDAATASDFARDIRELRSTDEREPARAADPRPMPKGRAAFDDDWDLPTPGERVPIDVHAEEVTLIAPPSPAASTPPVPPQAPPPVPERASVPSSGPAPASPPAAAPWPAPIALPPPAPPPAPAPAAAAAAPASDAAGPKPSLSAAFAALLAVEKTMPQSQAQKAPELTEAAIEAIVKRVLARMTSDTVNRVVLETAERLIREEIARTKGSPGQ